MAAEPSAVVKTQRSETRLGSKPAAPTILQSKAARSVAAVSGMGLALAVWLAFFANDPLDAQRERLAKLSPDARSEIAAKTRIFDALEDDEKRSVRQVAAFVNAKSGSDRTIADAAIRSYKTWLNTLPMSDHDAIMKAPTAEARKLEVDRTLTRISEEAASQEGNRRYGERMLSFELSAARFAELTRLLERAAGREPDESRNPLLRTTEIVVSQIDESQTTEQNRIALSAFFERLNESEIDQFLPNFVNERIGRDHPMRTFVIARVVLESIDSERLRQVRALEPSNDELDEYFETLPLSEQDKLLELPASQFQSVLTMNLMGQKMLDADSSLTPEKLEHFGRFSRWLKDMGRQFSKSRPPFGNGHRTRDDRGVPRPGDRGSFDRGGFDRREPGDLEGRGGRFGGDRPSGRGGPRPDGPRPDGPRNNGPRPDGPPPNGPPPQRDDNRGDAFRVN